MEPRSCAIDEAQLWDLLDDPDADAPRELRAHVESCPSCRECLERLRRVHEGLTALCSADPTPLPASIGPYRIVRRLGEGGMGVVYEAEQPNPARRVALKVLRPVGPSTAGDLRRFEREVQALAKLRHACLVVIHDAGRDGGFLYLVMELVEGEPLDRHCARTSASLQRRLELIAQTAEAIHHAHERGVVHLDVKPTNVLVDGDGRPRVLDFGLARFLRPDGNVSLSRSVLASPGGTIPYMSPEQLGGTPAIDRRSDVYSLGVMLHELLTGRLPYGAPTSLAEAVRTFASPDVAHAVARADSIPRPLRDIVLQAIAVDRTRRYGSALDLAADLRRHLAGEAVRARVARRLPSWFGRGRWPWLAASALAVLAAILFLPSEDTDTRPRLAQRMPIDIPDVLSDAGSRRTFDALGDGAQIVYAVGFRLRVWDRVTGIGRPLGGGGGPDDIAEFRCTAPRWSPDGLRIAAVGNRQGEAEQFVLVWNAAEARIEQALPAPERGARIRDVCWTPDGHEITCLTDRIDSIRLVGGTVRRHPTDLPPVSSLGGWSADGRWLVVDATRSEGPPRSDLWLVPRVGGSSRQLTTTPDDCHQPVWAPDGRSVWFVASGTTPAASGSDIWRLAVDGETGRATAAPRRVTFLHNEGFVAPRFLSDGALLVGVRRDTATVWTTTGDRFEEGTEHTRGRAPRLSADGRTVFFIGEVSGQRGLFAMPRGGGAARLLTSAAYDASGPLGVMSFGTLYDVAPDSTRIAFSSWTTGDPDRAEVCVQSIDSGDLRVLARTSCPVWIRWSPDSCWLAYVDGRSVLVVAADGSDAPRELARLPRWDGTLEWSPNGDFIAALGYATDADLAAHVNTAFAIAFPVGELTRMTPPEEARYKEGLVWHPSGEFVTYVDYGPANDSQIRFAWLDGRPTEVAIQQSDSWDWIGAWAPDGERFYFFSYGGAAEGSPVHVYDRQARQVVTRGVPGMSSLPRWSAGGNAAVWIRGRQAAWLEILAVDR
ncbi:MAG: serine/threonine-protein kinase [Planctomycetes bacterium]|nr:serine/threonine-protein kinase [Planctomycetota bacterium]